QVTGNPLDAAIVGTGFFAVEMPDGTVAYTRAGSFSRSADGWLVTQDGRRVLGMSGAIAIDGRDVRIDEAGRIYADGALAGQLVLWEFSDSTALQKLGSNLFAATAAAGPPVPREPTLSVGSIEASNVNVVSEMVNLISVQRAYEAAQRAVQAHDQTLGMAVRDIAGQV
ncbi:MAG TPA: flagellar hook-basal body protein, partial [Limnochordia bacterium]